VEIKFQKSDFPHVVIVLEGLSREFWEGLPMELLYANDLVLMAGMEELLVEKIQKWRRWGSE